MQIKKIIILIAISFLAVSLVKASVQYPIEELGNCDSKTNCKTYCDKQDNMESCISFAQKNGLMTQEEVVIAKKFVSTDNSEKPGQCTTKDSCEEYCNNIDNIDECLKFAEKNNILPPEELAQAKKVQSAIARGVKPPSCGNKKSCDIYCDNPENMEECMNFAIEAGFMNEQEKADSQKMLMAIKRGVKPPKCKGKEECDTYCSDPENMEECMNFAMEAGFMGEQEKADSQKMLSAIKKGVKPPKCKGKEECDTYCNEESHFEECLNFAEAAGFMKPEEAVMARKTGGKGPGGCKGKEECEAFCNNPDNQETCFAFGKENGMIPEEDLKRMEQGKGKMDRPQQGDENGQSIQAGPGGCKGPDECQGYCEKNPQECQNFKNPQGMGAPNCSTPEECQKIGEQIQQRMQQETQEMPQGMPAPVPCQGENCSYGGPLPSSTMQPGQMPQGPMPPNDSYQPMPQVEPIQQPQDRPTNQMSPQEYQQPMPQPQIAPSPETAPSPTSLNNTNLFLGFIYWLSPLVNNFLLP